VRDRNARIPLVLAIVTVLGILGLLAASYVWGG
jgi:hypothetical protein